jgi:ATP-dependent protease ClpP protease subunit
MLKRKYNMIENDNESENYLKEFTENIFKIGQNKKFKFNALKSEDVYRENNNIYFKTDVTIETCDILCQLVREFEEEIKNIKSQPYSEYFTTPVLYIHVTSYGGDLFASLICYDTLKSKSYKIITIAEGYVASAGTLIMLGGHHRQIQKSAVMLIHQLSTGIYGKFDELQEELFNSTETMKRIINIYFEEFNNKMTKKQIEEALKHDIWWNAKKCLQKGLVNEII